MFRVDFFVIIDRLYLDILRRREVFKMAYVCGKCQTVHPPGAVSCEDARNIGEAAVKDFKRKVRRHKKGCLGCPDPEQHVENIERIQNPPRGPTRFARKI